MRWHIGALLACLAMLGAGPGAAQIVSWIKDGNGEWATGSNWSTGLPPGASADVVIDRGLADPVVTLLGLFEARSVQSAETVSIGAFGASTGGALFLTAPSSFSAALMHLCCTLSSSSTIDVSGRLTVFNSVLRGSGTTTATGGIDVTGPLFWLLDGHKVVNSGVTQVNSASGSTTLNISLGSRFTNLASGTLEIQTSLSVNSTSHGSGAPGTFENHGLVKVSANAGIGLINNYGTIDITAGGLNFFGNNYGTIHAASGTLLGLFGTFGDASVINATGANVTIGAATVAGVFNAGAVTVNDYATLTAANATLGPLKIVNARLRLDTGTPLTVPSLSLHGSSVGSFTGIVGGARGGSDVLNVTGVLEWLGGTLTDAGTTNALGGIEIRRGDNVTTGGKRLDGSHILNNFATATFSDFNLAMGGTATFNNKPGALVDFTQNVGVESSSFGSGPVFNNDGTVRKSGGDAPAGILPTPSSRVAVAFNNRGLVEVNSGLLRLEAGGTSTGSFTVASGKAIEFAGGHVLETTSSVNAAAATVFFSSSPEDRIAGHYQAGRTVVAGNVAFVGNAPTLGTLELTSGHLRLVSAQATSAGGAVHQFGTLTIDGGAVLRIGAGATYTQTFGTTVVDGLLDTPLADMRGVLAGSGSIMGSLVHGGRLRPGGAAPGGAAGGGIGKLTVLGEFTQLAGGQLLIGILGHQPASQHDVLAISGHATLAGSLIVELLDGYVPVLGDIFTILTFSSRTGSLAFTSGSAISPTLRFVPVYDGDSLALHVTAVPEARTWVMMAMGLMLVIGWGRMRGTQTMAKARRPRRH